VRASEDEDGPGMRSVHDGDRLVRDIDARLQGGNGGVAQRVIWPRKIRAITGRY
jgi:hypothetical protein